MEIRNLAIGHGVIYYEVWYRSFKKKDRIVQYIALFMCNGYIVIDRYEFIEGESFRDRSAGYIPRWEA